MRIYYIDRRIQIKHFSDLSVLDGLKPISELSLNVPKTEEFVLQLAVVADGEEKIERVSFDGNIPMFCVNTQITDKFGHSYEKSVVLHKNCIRPLFFVLHTNEQYGAESAHSEIRFQTDKGVQTVALTVHYTEEEVANSGYNDLWRLSRLIWLNSTRFLNNAPVAPYFAPIIEGNAVKILGRDISFGENGLPKQMESYFDESISLKQEIQKTLFASPMDFCIEGLPITWSPLKIKQEEGTFYVTAEGVADGINLRTETTLYYEGFLDCSVFVTAEKDFCTENVSLTSSLQKDCADYINGLGVVGSAAHQPVSSTNLSSQRRFIVIGAPQTGHFGISSDGIFISFCSAIISFTTFSLSYVLLWQAFEHWNKP